MRRFRGESGQVAIFFALFMALAGVGLLLGSLGVAEAFWSKSSLQSAADAATLAVSRRAEGIVTIQAERQYQVYIPLKTCPKPKKKGKKKSKKAAKQCQPEPARTTRTALSPATVSGSFQTLVAHGAWVRAAGCSTRSRDAPRTLTGVLCTHGRITGHRFVYPPGMGRLAASVLRANGVKIGQDVKVASFSAQNGSGRVTLALRATSPGNPMSVVVRHPVAVEVRSFSRPQLQGSP